MTHPMLTIVFIILFGAAAAASLLLSRRLAVTQAALAAAEAGSRSDRRAHEQQLAALQAATEEKVALVRGSREELANEMKAISAGVLQQTSEQVAKLAAEARRADRDVASAELAKRTEEIKRMLDPVTKGIAELERDRKASQGQFGQMYKTLTQQVERLRTETGTLVNALRKPQVRGAWGEMQLRNCVEAANMTANVDFLDQQTYTDDEGGRLRPDMVVRLPAGKSVVVDSKVPLDAYLAAYDATDDAERDLHLDRHARQLKTHLDTLASKTYHASLDESPEFVVCFIPNEGIYCAALDRDPSLLEHGAGKGVLIATPTTLMALLHAVYYGWRQETIAESAREIADAARELHKRIGTFLEPFAKVGRQLRSSVDAYNTAVGSMDARVLPQLRRIEEAGAGSEKALAEPVPIDATPRLIVAPETLPGADAAGPAALPDAA